MPSYYPSGKYELSMCSFLEYNCTIVFLNDISGPYQIDVWFGERYKGAQSYFSPEFDILFQYAF